MTAYPAWICEPCGREHGRVKNGHLATFHEPDQLETEDKCGWCGTQKEALTEPRDFGYPSALTALPKLRR